MESIVVDTGPLVAWFDPSDKHHAVVDRWLEEHGTRFRRYTTLAVVTEALHLLDIPAAQAGVLDWLGAGGAVMVPVENTDLAAIAANMRRYRDTPMDFADASILWLADRLSTRSVLTIDQRGFATYRLAGGRRPVLELQKSA